MARLLVAALSVVFVLAGCAEWNGPSVAETNAPLTPQVGKPAPDFTLPDLAGKPVTLSSFRGNANVLVHFGVTWCGHCMLQVPELKRLQPQYTPAELTILYVDIGESADTVRAFVKREGIEYPTLLDPDSRACLLYAVEVVPRNFLVDKAGVVRSVSVSVPYGEIRALAGK